MGGTDTIMMLGVVVVGGYVALKVMPQMLKGMTPAPAPAPVAPAQPACGVTKCDDKGDDVSCQCTGQAAFAMGQSRDCNDCTEVCKQRCAGQGNFVPDSPDDNDDDDDDNYDDDRPSSLPGGSGLRNSSGNVSKGECDFWCANPNHPNCKSCKGNYARKVSYNTLLTTQTMNRIRRAKLAQAYYNMSYDPSRII
jgi:hypothetical protein